MNSLRKKLIASYGILIAIIFAVSAWSIYHLVNLGRAIDVILVHNYKSILAAENMKEALERQDSSAQFFLSGYTDKARQQFTANAAKFDEQYQLAASNITEKGEDKIVADISAMYTSYRRELETFLASPNARQSSEVDTYFQHLEPDFLALKNRLDDLLHLNQQAMLDANDRALSQSWQAEVSMAMLALFALIVALIFAWRFTDSIVRPITIVSDKAKLIGEGDFTQHINIQSNDEIGALAAEFNRMAVRLRDLHQSEQWQILLERKKSDAVIDSLYEPVIVTDAQGQVTKINKSAGNLFRASFSNSAGDMNYSLSGFSAGERILRAVRDAVTMQKAIAAEGEAALVPMKIGETERSYQMRTTPVRDADGRLLGAVTLLEDITALREVDRLKTEFIEIASNKLRDPLRSLQLALYAVIEKYTGELTDEQSEMLLEARRNAEQLDEIMNDLLELSEIESGTRKLFTERLRPAEIVRAAVERFQSAADARHIRLINKVSTDVAWVVADRQAMRRIFDHLLTNAIRHTGRDGEVKIEAEDRADRVVFRVSDTGEGIPEEQLTNLFNRFVQMNSQTSGGTGMGLAIVKRLIEAQGGQISVESRVGEGTIFLFTLPIGGYSSARR